MINVYGDKSPNYSTVAKWSAEGKSGQHSLEDNFPTRIVTGEVTHILNIESVQYKGLGSLPPNKYRTQGDDHGFVLLWGFKGII